MSVLGSGCLCEARTLTPAWLSSQSAPATRYKATQPKCMPEIPSRHPGAVCTRGMHTPWLFSPLHSPTTFAATRQRFPLTRELTFPGGSCHKGGAQLRPRRPHDGRTARHSRQASRLLSPYTLQTATSLTHRPRPRPHPSLPVEPLNSPSAPQGPERVQHRDGRRGPPPPSALAALPHPGGDGPFLPLYAQPPRIDGFLSLQLEQQLQPRRLPHAPHRHRRPLARLAPHQVGGRWGHVEELRVGCHAGQERREAAWQRCRSPHELGAGVRGKAAARIPAGKGSAPLSEQPPPPVPRPRPRQMQCGQKSRFEAPQRVGIPTHGLITPEQQQVVGAAQEHVGGSEGVKWFLARGDEGCFSRGGGEAQSILLPRPSTPLNPQPFTWATAFRPGHPRLS